MSKRFNKSPSEVSKTQSPRPRASCENRLIKKRNIPGRKAKKLSLKLLSAVKIMLHKMIKSIVNKSGNFLYLISKNDAVKR